MIERALTVVVTCFPISEITLALMRRSRRRSAHREDRGSMALLWLAIAIGLVTAIASQDLPATRLSGSPSVVNAVALALLVAGLTTRWIAILTLGRLFTVDVSIQPGHAVVQRGMYRYVRHPSYTGLFVAFLGLGIYFGNWLSLVLLLAPIALAILNRVAKEEEALLRALGPEYAAYCARTKRFIPGVV